MKGTPVFTREKRDNACQNEHENMLHEISDEEGDVDAEVLVVNMVLATSPQIRS